MCTVDIPPKSESVSCTLEFRKQRIKVLFNPRIFYLPGTSNCSQKSLNIWIEILFYNIKFYNYSREHISLEFSVRPKPGFGIGNRNQDQVLVSVSEPKLFLPKPKLPPFSFPQIFLMLFVPCFEYFPCHTELSCKTFFNYLSNFHWLVCISELLT